MSLIGEVYKVEFNSESNSWVGAFCFLSEDKLLLNFLDNEHGSWIKQLEDSNTPKSVDFAVDVMSREPNVVFNYVCNKESVVRSELDIAEYYPRIWRGIHSLNIFEIASPIKPLRIYGSLVTQSSVAVDSLFKSIEELFRFYEPSIKNREAFGHRNRELLILLCTEIENAWRSVLNCNLPLNLIRNRYNTGDYIKLKEPLKLDAWKVKLSNYPDYPEICPFESWAESAPTNSIAWYEAYNSVKHDREGAFEKATFKHLLDAAAALHIMQCAQWGLENRHYTIFDTLAWPQFKIEEQYVCPVEGETWIEKKYFSE